jgi:hypothetical protein
VAGAGVKASIVQTGKRAERVFFSAYLVALAALIFAGFAPSFYLRGFVEPYWEGFPLAPLVPLLMAHGIVTTAWVLLFLIQAALIATGRRQLHQRVGNWGFAVGAVVVVLAYLVAARFSHSAVIPPRNVADVFMLAALLAIAWCWRRDAQAHKRIMLPMLCVLAMSAVERIPFFLYSGVAPLFAVPLIMPLWAWDLATRSRPHIATVTGTVLLAVVTIPRVFRPPDSEWSQVVALLPGFGWP